MASTNLVLPLTSFIGRTQELAEIKKLLERTRLLTLIGVGGCGKTRLAMQVANELSSNDSFSDGVWWVNLAGLNDASLVPHVVAKALGMQEVQHTTDIMDVLNAYLFDKHLLLVIDNCEHLLTTCGQLIQDLVSNCRQIQIMATSREAFRLTEEISWLVPSLTLPDSPPSITEKTLQNNPFIQNDAILLFTERASAINNAFKITNENARPIFGICKRLDGLPLAIELAAARVNILTVHQIEDRLDDCFALLTAGNRTALIPRHQTLRTTLDWSFALLSTLEQMLFVRMSIFSGDFTIDAVEAICTQSTIDSKEVLDLISHLIDKSLLVVDTQKGRHARYRFLEIIRQYAFEKLESTGEVKKFRFQHLIFFTELAEKSDEIAYGMEQVDFFDQLEANHDNLRAAIHWSLKQEDKIVRELGVRMSGSLGLFWFVRGYWVEGVETLNQIVQKSQGQFRHELAKVKLSASLLNCRLSKIEIAIKMATESFSLYASLKDKKGMADSLFYKGIAIRRENLEAADTLFKESLALYRKLDNKKGIAGVLGDLGISALDQDNLVLAKTYLEESLIIRKEIGDVWGIAHNLYMLGELALEQNNYEEAQSLQQEGLALRYKMEDKEGIADVKLSLGQLAIFQSDLDGARLLANESLELYKDLRNVIGCGGAYVVLADLSRYKGEFQKAEKLYNQGFLEYRQSGSAYRIATVQLKLGVLAIGQQNYKQAKSFLEEALFVFHQHEKLKDTARTLVYLAAVMAAQQRFDLAAISLGQSEKIMENIDQSLNPYETADRDQVLSIIKVHLAEAEISAAWAKGRVLPRDEVINRALRNDETSKFEKQVETLSDFNSREIEILGLIAEGASNQEIAEKLILAVSTVKWYINIIFGKLNVHNRTQAVARARDLALL